MYISENCDLTLVLLALTDSTGNIQTRYTYDPYGNTTTTGQGSTNPFQYTGRENDGAGLYYYRARYYSTTHQRFISSDPIGLDGGLNTYLYANANPLRFIDPDGHLGWDTVIKWGAQQLLKYGAKEMAGDPMERGAKHERQALEKISEQRYWQCVQGCRSNNCLNKQDPSTWQSTWDQKQACEQSCQKQW